MSPISSRRRISVVLAACLAVVAALLAASAEPSTAIVEYGHIVGTIKRADGMPNLGSLVVTAYKADDPTNSPKTSPGSFGTYSIELRPGRYYLQAEDQHGQGAWEFSGHTSIEADAKVFEVKAGETLHADDFVLQKGATFTTRTALGFHAVSSNVFLKRLNHGAWVYVHANVDRLRRESGYITLTGIPAGTYVLAGSPVSPADNAAAEYYPRKDSPAEARKFTVALGQAVTVRISYRRGARVTGRIVGADGRPVSGRLDVQYEPAVDPLSSPGLQNVTEIPRDVNSRGYFTLKGLSTGTYLIRFVGGDAADQGQYLTIDGRPDDPATRIPVTAGRSTRLPTTRLREAGTLAVKVVDLAGHPIQGVHASIEDAWSDPTEDYNGLPDPSDPHLTGPDGVYSFGPRQADDEVYHVFLRDHYGRYKDTFYGGPTLDQAIDVSAVPGTSQTFNVVMRPEYPRQLTRETYTGEPVVGSTLTVDPGTYLPSDAVITFQWHQSDTGPIAGATGRSYTLRPSDVGHIVFVNIRVAHRGVAAEWSIGPSDPVRPAAG